MKTKSFYPLILALSLLPSNSQSKIIRDGNCMRIMDHGTVVGEMCSRPRGPRRPFSPGEFEKRLKSVVDVEKILRHSNLKPEYSGYSTPTLVKAIISVENYDANP